MCRQQGSIRPTMRDTGDRDGRSSLYDLICLYDTQLSFYYTEMTASSIRGVFRQARRTSSLDRSGYSTLSTRDGPSAACPKRCQADRTPREPDDADGGRVQFEVGSVHVRVGRCRPHARLRQPSRSSHSLWQIANGRTASRHCAALSIGTSGVWCTTDSARSAGVTCLWMAEPRAFRPKIGIDIV